ncbi:MAG: S41 family peptidase [Chthoniobacterales bacterium]
MTRKWTLLLALTVGSGISALAETASPTPSPALSPAPSASASPSASPSPQATPIPSPTPDLETLINGMNGAQIDKALSTIKANYFDATASTDEEAKRAQLEGIIIRSGPGIDVLIAPKNAPEIHKVPFLSEILDARIGYLRVGSISSESLAQMDTSLKKFSEQKLNAVVVDLRGCPPSYDYELARGFARRFCKKGKLLFSIQKPSAKQERLFSSDMEPLFEGIVIVITDEYNMGAAEAVAGALRASAGAMIVGEKTSGGAIEFTDVDLGQGKTLRVANAQVVLPTGGSLYPKGVQPDIEVQIDPRIQKEIVRLSADKGISQFVFEKEYGRMSEAALVNNTNPEIESVQEIRRNGGKEQPHDVALQRAVDLVTTIDFYKKQK